LGMLAAVSLGAARPALPGPEVPSAGPAPAFGPGDTDRLRYLCGPNAAYVLARMHGMPLTYDGLNREFGDLLGGVSLRRLRDVMGRIGLPCEVRYLHPAELIEAPLPAIVLIRPEYSGGTIGHFIVIAGASRAGVRVVDPITGVRDNWGWPYFSDAWTGYALVPRPDPGVDRVLLALFGSCGLATLGLGLVALRSSSAPKGRYRAGEGGA